MNQLLYSENTKEENTKPKILIAIGIFLLVIFLVVFLLLSKVNNKILANVYLGSVNVGLQTKEEAMKLIDEKYTVPETNTVKISHRGKSLAVSPSDVGYATTQSTEELVEKAYQYGREGNFFTNGMKALGSYFKDTVYDVEYAMDEEKLEKVLQKLTSGDSEIAKDDGYEVSGEEVVITKGTDGVKVDEELAKEYVVTAFRNQTTTVDLPTKVQNCKVLNLDELYIKLAVEPEDAKVISGENFEIVPEKSGLTFDKAKVKKEYQELEAGESMSFVLTPVEASVKAADLEAKMFETKLASCSTTTANRGSGRDKNVATTCAKINDVVVKPGEIFSFNEAVGLVSTKTGYAMSSGFAGDRVVSMIGGGMCQVSTTLYNAVLLANLEISERTAHGMPVTYGDPGLDATFAEDAIDFKFENSRNYPIKIVASEANGSVLIEIFGTKEENEPVIELESVVLEKLAAQTIEEEDNTLEVGQTKVVQNALDGYEAEAYKIVKDQEGKVISRTRISVDTYSPINKIVKVGTKTLEPVTPTKPTTTKPSNKSEDPEIVVYDEEPKGGSLPSGWDSPESPYSRH